MLIRDNVEATDNGEQIDLFKKAASILNGILQQVKIKPFFKKNNVQIKIVFQFLAECKATCELLWRSFSIHLLCSDLLGNVSHEILVYCKIIDN